MVVVARWCQYFCPERYSIVFTRLFIFNCRGWGKLH